MIPGSRPYLRSLLLLTTAAAFVCACTSAAPGKTKRRTPADPDDELFGWDELEAEPEPLPTSENADSGAFGAPARPKTTDGGPVDAGPVDAGPKVACASPLGPGDLAIAELMVSSRSGSGDEGEWIEIRSTRDCWLDVKGVSIASPRGATGMNVATIDEDFELAPGGTFVVAGSADPAKNHQLPGKVFAWAATDVLKNDGDTVRLELGATVIDAVTYPAFTNLTPGRSLAFPDDCAPADRADWQRWSLAFTAWSTGFQGTPNAPNADVTCF